MATVKDRCVFFVEIDQCTFITKTNGDKVNFGKGLKVRQEDATALTYLIQSGKRLRVVIKEV